MFEEYERVRIKPTGVTGIIVDKVVIDGVAKYIVESDDLNENAPHGGEWPLYHCNEQDLSPITEDKTA